MTKKSIDNSWITAVSSETTPFLRVYCKHARRESRMVAIVLRVMGPGYDDFTLHAAPRGVGHPLTPAGGQITVRCRCRGGHPLSQTKLIEEAESGPKDVTVEDLRP